MIPTPNDPNFTIDVSEEDYYNPPKVEDEDLLDYIDDWEEDEED